MEVPGFVPTVCPSILAALERGRSRFLEVLAYEVHDRSSDGPVAFALVAEDSSGGTVGAIVCAPPYEVIETYANHFPALAQQTELQGFIGLSKIVGVAVQEDFRSNGIGTEHIRIAQQILQRCGIALLYGRCPACHELEWRASNST